MAQEELLRMRKFFHDGVTAMVKPLNVCSLAFDNDVQNASKPILEMICKQVCQRQYFINHQK